MPASDAITVVVRMRPLNKREMTGELPGKVCTTMFQTEATIKVADPAASMQSKNSTKDFTFDHVFDSSKPGTEDYSTQDYVFGKLLTPLINHACDLESGGNTCLFAYGLTGTGKTYTMMGYGPVTDYSNADPEGRGMVPRCLDAMFSMQSSPRLTVSYMELYNDKLRDLLAASSADGKDSPSLVIHTHPKFGVYVQGLVETTITSLDQALKLLDYGNKMRSVAATNMNKTSSRSHAIFQIKVYDPHTEDAEFVPNRLNLVDLAGRENEKNTAATGERLRELSFINKSLFELANCIHALSSRSKSIPFRNNDLTLILSDCLQPPTGGGGSKTAMMAAITPAASSYADTMATLRFAAAAKTIQTRKVIAGTAGMTSRQKDAAIKQLQQEISELKKQLQVGSEAGEMPDEELKGLVERAKAAEAIAESYKKKWEDVVSASAEGDADRASLLKTWKIDQSTPEGNVSRVPLLVNMCDDQYLQGSLVYALNRSTSLAGSDPSDNIRISGLGISGSMVTFKVDKKTLTTTILVNPDVQGKDANRFLLNGKRVTDEAGEIELRHNDRLIFGHALAFLFVNPQETAHEIHSGSISMPSGSPTIEDALNEIADEGGDQYRRISDYLEYFSVTHGETVARAFKSKLLRACPFVDEANEITKELREHEGLRFRLAIVDKATGIDNDDVEDAKTPQLVVRLIQSEEFTPKKRWLEAGRKIGLNALKSQHRVLGVAQDVVNWMHLDMDPNESDKEEVELLIWGWDKFLGRLQSMRDLYDRFHRGHLSLNSQNATDAFEAFLTENPHEDAWREFGPQHIAVLKTSQSLLEERVSALSSDLSKFRAEAGELKKKLKEYRKSSAQKRISEVENDIKSLDVLADSLQKAMLIG